MHILDTWESSASTWQDYASLRELCSDEDLPGGPYGLLAKKICMVKVMESSSIFFNI